MNTNITGDTAMSWQVRQAYRIVRAGNFECDNVKERAPVFFPDSHHAAGGVGFSTVNVLRAFCEVNNVELDSASEYGEPGYGNEHTKAVLLSNWNRVPKKLQTRLESQGYELEWSDEWTIDYENDKAYRTSPDSHGWESRIAYTECGDLLTPDSDAQEWIDYAMNEDSRVLPSWFDDSELETRGFGLLNADDKQVGFHPGQDETPDKAGVPALRAEGFDTVLQISGRGQFDVSYRIWTRREAQRGVLFDEASGVYIPRRFAREIDRERCTFDTKFGENGPNELSDWEILEAGPDHEHYWEVWDDVLRDCELTLDDGTKVRLEQDGSVFYTEVGAEYCEAEDAYYVHK